MGRFSVALVLVPVLVPWHMKSGAVLSIVSKSFAVTQTIRARRTAGVIRHIHSFWPFAIINTVLLLMLDRQRTTVKTITITISIVCPIVFAQLK